MVYVVNKNGQPLMPTENHAKVRILLKSGKAKVINRCPFTIQLTYESTNYTQKVPPVRFNYQSIAHADYAAVPSA